MTLPRGTGQPASYRDNAGRYDRPYAQVAYLRELLDRARTVGANIVGVAAPPAG